MDKELITSLANSLCDYDVDYEIIDNPELEWISEDDDTYLNFPYAARFFIKNSERYLGKEFSIILNVNEQRDGLEYWSEDYPMEVDNPEWIFLLYSDRLQNRIRTDNAQIEKLEYELSKQKSEFEYNLRKLEDRLIEVGA